MVHRCFMLLFYHQEIFPPTGRIQGEFPEFLDVHRFFTIYQIFMVIFLEFFMYLPGHNSKYEKRDALTASPFPYLPDFFYKVYVKLDIENPIIRINTAFKGCSSLEKISVLPRIYHN